MKPIVNFRARLNMMELWMDGVLYRIKLPVIGAEDLVWIVPENVSHKWNVYLTFRWEEEKVLLNRSQVEVNTHNTSEFLQLLTIDVSKCGTLTDFVDGFLRPLIKDLNNKDIFWK